MTTRLQSPGRRRATDRGFSLVELMVVVVILGLLATAVIFAVGNEIFTSKRTVAQSQMEQMGSAVERFRLTPGVDRLPDTLEELVEGPSDYDDGEWNPPISRIPDDPWGNEYQYEPDGSRKFEIICYGADGEEGGEGEDADLYYPEREDD